MDSEHWTLGRQLWVMRADGSEAHPLTDEPDYNHSALGWSPDSSTLVYMRFNQSDIAQPAEIWVIGADGEGAHSVATGGFSPRWMP
jgi:Tol biopolymer transport system component